MKELAVIMPFIMAMLVLVAYAPVIKLSLDYYNKYQENFEDLKAGNTDALEESLIEPLEEFLPSDPEEVAKDTVLDILREIILQRFIGRRISQD